MKTIQQIAAAERHEQRVKHGYTAEHDAQHRVGEISSGAAMYAAVASEQAMNLACGGGFMPQRPPALRVAVSWCWAPDQFRPSGHPVKNLVKAIAMLEAEAERLTDVLGPAPEHPHMAVYRSFVERYKGNPDEIVVIEEIRRTGEVDQLFQFIYHTHTGILGMQTEPTPATPADRQRIERRNAGTKIVRITGGTEKDWYGPLYGSYMRVMASPENINDRFRHRVHNSALSIAVEHVGWASMQSINS